MSSKVFDKNISGLPDLKIHVDPQMMIQQSKLQQEGDELVIPNSPTSETYKMRTSEIFVMRQKQQQEKQENIKLEIEKKELNPGIKKEPEVEELINFEAEAPVTLRGKRGNDKKPRKKRVMTDKQKENLKKAREKSLAVRRAKKAAKVAKLKPIKEEVKVQPLAMPPPTPPIPIQNQAPMSYEYFANMMDKYENRKKKKHTTTAEPHPNKVIPHQEKPRPPIQKVQRNAVNVRQPPSSFDPYPILNNNSSGNKSLFGSAFGY